MEIIPVIDLLNGQVIRAQRGAREHYHPISSTLCRSSKPLEVAHALLELYPFKILYIADLDAIQQRGNHHSVIAALHDAYPDIALWLDAGFSDLEDCQNWQEFNVTFVAGSESLTHIDALHRMHQALGDEKLVLSLDWRGDTPLGLPALFESSQHWPQRIIAMPLSSVGSHAGPDIEKLCTLRSYSMTSIIYAAGGVRNLDDLHALENNGISGSLIASALHDNTISKEDLKIISQ